MVEIRDIVFVYRLMEARNLALHTRYHSHGPDCFELHYILGGRGFCRMEGVKLAFGPGSVIICPPQMPHSLEPGDMDNPVSYYAVLFFVEDKPENRPLRELLFRAAGKKPLNIGLNYRFCFEEIKENNLSMSENRRLSAVHRLLAFIYTLEDSYSSGSEAVSIHLEKALDLMQERVFEKLTLKSIAKELQITESYLIRLFRLQLNVTPMKYFTRLKVEAATSMLLETQKHINEIADILRFSSEYHFSRVFKQYTGFAPTQYRSLQYCRHISYQDGALPSRP